MKIFKEKCGLVLGQLWGDCLRSGAIQGQRRPVISLPGSAGGLLLRWKEISGWLGQICESHAGREIDCIFSINPTWYYLFQLISRSQVGLAGPSSGPIMTLIAWLAIIFESCFGWYLWRIFPQNQPFHVIWISAKNTSSPWDSLESNFLSLRQQNRNEIQPIKTGR